MAISPNHLNEEFMKEVDYFESRFDKNLALQKMQPGGSMTIEPVPSGYTMAHHAIIAERYKAAGWKDVSYNSDQREGTWLTFTSK
jgi:hypothetical protein